MKEQLANMTIIELVRTAHNYATSIQQIDTYSAIVTEMASRLEALNLAHIGGMNSLRSAISDRDQLAAENAALTQFIEADCWVIDADRDEYIDAVQCVPETPATDAWQREQMAKGVEAFADTTEKNGWHHSTTAFIRTFAVKLRNGEAV